VKACDVKIGVTYVNHGAGRTRRTVLAIGNEHRPGKWWGGYGSVPPDEPGVLYEQGGEQRTLYLSYFAAWAKEPVKKSAGC